MTPACPAGPPLTLRVVCPDQEPLQSVYPRLLHANSGAPISNDIGLCLIPSFFSRRPCVSYLDLTQKDKLYGASKFSGGNADRSSAYRVNPWRMPTSWARMYSLLSSPVRLSDLQACNLAGGPRMIACRMKAFHSVGTLKIVLIPQLSTTIW